VLRILVYTTIPGCFKSTWTSLETKGKQEEEEEKNTSKVFRILFFDYIFL
jgi:hypothetical protein